MIVAALLFVLAGCSKTETAIDENPGNQDQTEQPDENPDDEGEENETPDDDYADDPSGIPHNEIHYTTADGKTLAPQNNKAFGNATVTKNVYENGKGRLIFNDDLSTIGSEAFSKLSQLTSIVIPASVTELGEGAFQECTGLTSVSLGSRLETIGAYAFYNCSKLDSITIPERVTLIDDYAFCNCKALAGQLVIPDSTTEIGGYAFSYCSSLEEVAMGSGVTTVGEYAFYYCTGLKSITISESIIALRRSAFSRCSALTSIYCKAVTPPSSDTEVLANTNNAPIYVPEKSVEAYKAAYYWESYADRIFGYDFEEAE